MNLDIDEKIKTLIEENQNKSNGGINAFDPELCSIEKSKLVVFEHDEIAMGCCEGCWSGCIGSCKYNSH